MRIRGTWGSRIPIGNLFFSNVIRAGMWWRLASRRFLNGMKHPAETVHLTNDDRPRTELDDWLARGYDKLNIGGGRKNLAGFVNIDFIRYPEAERIIAANILDLSFIADGSISQVHSNHVVEHLTESELTNQLGEYHRILKANGLLTLRCPNALGGAYAFWFPPVIEGDRLEFVQLGFPADEDLANPDDAWIHRDFYGLLHWYFGDAGNIANQHLTLITPSRIRNLLHDAGFVIVKMAEPEAINIVVVARKSEAIQSIEA